MSGRKADNHICQACSDYEGRAPRGPSKICTANDDLSVVVIEFISEFIKFFQKMAPQGALHIEASLHVWHSQGTCLFPMHLC